MGFMSKLFGGGGNDDDGDEFVEEDEFVEGEGWDDEDEWGEEEEYEQEVMEWDSAYQFAAEMLEEQGFTSMNDFVAKSMFRRVRQSPEFRDRIESGVSTIDKLARTKQQMAELRGGGGGTDWEEVATKMESADRAIQAADSMSGKEDMMVQQALAVGSRLADSFAKGRVQQRAGGDVDASMNVNEDRL